MGLPALQLHLCPTHHALVLTPDTVRERRIRSLSIDHTRHVKNERWIGEQFSCGQAAAPNAARDENRANPANGAAHAGLCGAEARTKRKLRDCSNIFRVTLFANGLRSWLPRSLRSVIRCNRWIVPMNDSPSLPQHVEDTVQAIARLHAEHHKQTSTSERMIDHLTSTIASVEFACSAAVFVAVWIAVNLLLPKIGYPSIDPPPFTWLAGGAGVLAVFMAVLIISSQRRADRLASRRAQLNLEISVLAEQKAAKIISLLEELRRDSPNVRDRLDGEAHAMAAPAEPHAVLEAFELTEKKLIDRDKRTE